MLSEQYKNALKGFQAQGSASHLFDGCDAEAQHIYRIVMTENVPVNQLDETMLEAFIDKEKDGLADYSMSVDRDGLQYVDLDQDVEIYPCITRGASTYPIEGESYLLPSQDAKAMIQQLTHMGRLDLLTDTMQSLAERADGTPLQTAFPDIEDLNSCITKGLALPSALLEKLKEWEKLGASEVNFNFVELA